MNNFFKVLIVVNTLLMIGLSFYFFKQKNNTGDNFYMFTDSIQKLENKISELEYEVYENNSNISRLKSEISNLESNLQHIRVVYDLY